MGGIASKVIKTTTKAIRKLFSSSFNEKKYLDKAKKIVLEALIRINALEGLKFYVSFLVTYKINDEFGNKIPGATKIIKLINYDEDLHTVVFSFLINTLRTQKREGFMYLFEKGENGEPSFFEKKAYEIYKEVYSEEIEWAKYLLGFCEARKTEAGTEIVKVFNIKDKKDVEFYNQTRILKSGKEVKIWNISGPNTIPGLTIEVFEQFMQYYTNDRLEDIGLEKLFKNIDKSPAIATWFKKYKKINDEKTAAQETEILSYSIGQLINDIDDGEFFTDLFDVSEFEY
jgi:ribonucleoside-diphosphate reductase beta chain